MAELRTRAETVARLLALGVTPEEIAAVAAQEAADRAAREAAALVRACQPPTRTRSAKRSPTPKPASSAAPPTGAPVPALPPLPLLAGPLCPAPSQPKKARYHLRNWNAYNQALVQRGSLTIWFDEAAIQAWLRNERAGQVGSPSTYADTAIMCALTLKAVDHLKLRQTEGFVRSLLQLMAIDLPVPDYTTLSRRASDLAVPLLRQECMEPIHRVVDATGLKVYGEGEWKVRQHGYTKRRTWRKVHLGVDEATGEIVAQATTTSSTSDKAMLPEILDQVDDPIKQVSADGGYDYQTCYEAIAEQGAQATIPPRENAVLNDRPVWQARNATIARIEEIGRKAWKEECGYHRRSLAETTMFRMKTIFGDDLQSRQDEGQKTEVAIRCAALNRMTHLGMPDSYRVTAA